MEKKWNEVFSHSLIHNAVWLFDHWVLVFQRKNNSGYRNKFIAWFLTVNFDLFLFHTMIKVLSVKVCQRKEGSNFNSLLLHIKEYFQGTQKRDFFYWGQHNISDPDSLYLTNKIPGLFRVVSNSVPDRKRPPVLVMTTAHLPSS